MLIQLFNDPASVRKHGLSFDGVVYECLRSDEDSIYSRHVILH